MAALMVETGTAEAHEARRRELLAESDELLDQVELAQMEEAREVPDALRDAIRALNARLGRPEPRTGPTTLRAAHDLVFAVQQRLMALNPINPQGHRHTGRPGGQPVVVEVRDRRLWKLLALPPRSGGDDEWLELVNETVTRAWDRWCYAQHHAVRAARDRRRPELALAVARTAWTNYWELCQEAERIRQRLAARPSHVPGGSATPRR